MIDAIAIPLNCGSFTGINSPSYEFTKPSFGGDKFFIETSPEYRTTSSTFSTIWNQKDLEFIRYSGASIITDYHINIQYQEPGYSDSIFFHSNNSGVLLSPNNLGLASGVNSGVAVLTAFSNGYFSTASVVVSANIGVASSGFNGYTSGSLAKNSSNAIDYRISGVVASNSTKAIFSTQNHSTATYIRNTGCWVTGVDLTCVSPWNSYASHRMAGTLISPRHIIFAAHFQIGNGSTIRFVDQNNNVITRTMTNKLTHPLYTPYYPDITIGVLDSDVPASISYAKILPQNWSNYLPSLQLQYTVPCLYIDQEEKALISEVYYLSDFAEFDSPDTSARLAFFENLISGDSGSPAFMIINNQLVILTVITFGGSGRGTSILAHKNAINSMMASLGGGYSLSEIDLSGFTYFS